MLSFSNPTLEYKEMDLIRINPIHPDHKKLIQHQFHVRRKQRHLKHKLDKHYKKVINGIRFFSVRR